MVDSRFVLKITDYGYAEFLESHCSPRPHPAPEGQLGGREPPAECDPLVLVKQREEEASRAPQFLCWDLGWVVSLFWKSP